VKAYYLLLAYAIATNKEKVPGKNPERSRQDVYAELREFLKSHPEAKLQRPRSPTISASGAAY